MAREPKKIDSLEVRLAPETKQAFMAACRAKGESASGVLRESIEVYLHPASRAPDDWRNKLMILAGRPRTTAAGMLAVVAVAAVSLGAPARAETDPRLAAWFDLVDSDHDGSVSPAEFAAPPRHTPGGNAVTLEVETRAPPRPGDSLEAIFARLDLGGNGLLSLDEAARGAVARTILTPALRLADRDRNGRIAEGELAAHLTAERARTGLPDPAAGVGLLDQGIIAEHDRDGDGLIALEDAAD